MRVTKSGSKVFLMCSVRASCVAGEKGGVKDEEGVGVGGTREGKHSKGSEEGVGWGGGRSGERKEKRRKRQKGIKDKNRREAGGRCCWKFEEKVQKS